MLISFSRMTYIIPLGNYTVRRRMERVLLWGAICEHRHLLVILAKPQAACQPCGNNMLEALLLIRGEQQAHQVASAQRAG